MQGKIKSNQKPFMIKTVNYMGIEGTSLNRVKAIYHSLVKIIILNWEKLQAFPLRSGTIKRRLSTLATS